MAYALLILEQPGGRTDRGLEQGRDDMDRMLQFAESLKARGKLTVAEALKSDRTAKRVSVRNGKPLVLDGPFSEAKEMIGGIFLLTVDSHAEAMTLAAECPATEWATVEVRELGPCFGD